MAGGKSGRCTEFQPTRPLRGATLPQPLNCPPFLISTHAPLAGRDYDILYLNAYGDISTHAPLAGRDAEEGSFLRIRNKFQPTRPLRGATPTQINTKRTKEISTHAPLAGRDVMAVWMVARNQFQPTRPLRGATLQRVTTTTSTLDFNPRAPCGARLSPLSSTGYCIGFQPTRPLRGATAKVYKSLCTFLR